MINWVEREKSFITSGPELVETTSRPVGFIYLAILVEQKTNNTENKTSIIPGK